MIGIWISQNLSRLGECILKTCAFHMKFLNFIYKDNKQRTLVNDKVVYMLKSLEGRALLPVIYFEMYQSLRRIHEWGVVRCVIKLKNSKIIMGESWWGGYSCSLWYSLNFSESLKFFTHKKKCSGAKNVIRLNTGI